MLAKLLDFKLKRFCSLLFGICALLLGFCFGLEERSGYSVLKDKPFAIEAKEQTQLAGFQRTGSIGFQRS